MDYPTKPQRFIEKQLAYKFAVSVNSGHAMKRNCLIAGSILCLDQSEDVKPLIVFLPHFKILYKKMGEHYTIYLNSRVEKYKMKLKLKSKNEAETSNFASALLVSRELYNSFVPMQIGYPIQAKGQIDYMEAILFVFEKSFEIQSEDGILLYNESLCPPPDVYPSPTENLKLIVSRNGEIKFDIQCVDIIEQLFILLAINALNPAKMPVKKSKKQAQASAVDKKEEKKHHKHSKTHAENEDNTKKKQKSSKNKSEIDEQSQAGTDEKKHKHSKSPENESKEKKHKHSKSPDTKSTGQSDTKKDGEEKKHKHKSNKSKNEPETAPAVEEKKRNKSVEVTDNKNSTQSPKKSPSLNDLNNITDIVVPDIDIDISPQKSPSFDSLNTALNPIPKANSLDDISQSTTTVISPSPSIELPQNLTFDEADDVSFTESTTISTFTVSTINSRNPEMLESGQFVKYAKVMKLEDYQLQLTNRSAFWHMREGYFKELFDKKSRHYKVNAEAHQMAVGYTPDEHELSLVPEIQSAHAESALNQLSRSKNMTFAEQMQQRLEEKYSHKKVDDKLSLKNIFSVIAGQYRMRDPIIAANPIPVIPEIEDKEGPKFKLQQNVFTDEIFSVKPNKDDPDINKKKNISEIYNKLSSEKFNLEKFGIKLPQKPELDIDVQFYNLIGRSLDRDFPALFATVLLHGAKSIPNIYNALSSLSFHVVEVSNIILHYPFSNFEECCRFFVKMLRHTVTSHFFATIHANSRFKIINYRADALIRIPDFALAISALSVPNVIPEFSTIPPPIFNYINFSQICDDQLNQYEAAPTFAWTRPIEVTSPISQFVFVMLYFYDPSFSQLLFSFFAKYCSKDPIYIKYFKHKELSKGAQLIAYILELLLTGNYSKFFLENYQNAVKYFKLKYTDTQVILLIDSFIKIEKALHAENPLNLVNIASDISKLIKFH